MDAVEKLNTINSKHEFLGYPRTGTKNVDETLCKVFLADDYVSIYSVKKNLSLLKKIPTKDIKNIALVPVIDKKEATCYSAFCHTVLGFLCFDLIGAIFGNFLATKNTETTTTYYIVITTSDESLVFEPQ